MKYKFTDRQTGQPVAIQQVEREARTACDWPDDVEQCSLFILLVLVAAEAAGTTCEVDLDKLPSVLDRAFPSSDSPIVIRNREYVTDTLTNKYKAEVWAGGF